MSSFVNPHQNPAPDKKDMDVQPEYVLADQKYKSLDRDGLMSVCQQQEVTISTQQQMITFLEQQIANLQTTQIKMGLMLDKIEIPKLFEKVIRIKKQTVGECRLNDYAVGERVFMEYCKSRGIVYADEITTDHDYEFREFLENFEWKPGHWYSVSRQLTIHKAVKCAFGIGFDQNNVIRNPFKNRVMPFVPCDDWWTDEYFYDLIDAVRRSHDYDKPGIHHRTDNRHVFETVIRVIYTTGIRVGIFCKARHEKVRVTDDGRCFVTLKMKVPKSSAIQEHTYEIVNNKAREMFLEYYDPMKKGLIFPIKKLDASLRDALRGRWNYRHGKVKYSVGICEKAGIPYKNPHKAKHGFITKLLIRGYSEVQIAKLTGNLDTTVIRRVYNHIQSSDFIDRVKIDIADL